MTIPHAVVEHEGYLRWVARNRFSFDDQMSFVLAVATDAHGGDIVEGTGGVRKIRAGIPSMGVGKSGGVRLFFLYLGVNAPVLLLAGVYKSTKGNLSKEERNELHVLVKVLKSQYVEVIRKNVGRRTVGSELFEDLKASLLEAIQNPTRTVLVPAAVARRQSGMTQEQFAKAVGVSVNTVQAWDQGRRRPSAAAWKTVMKLVKRTQGAF